MTARKPCGSGITRYVVERGWVHLVLLAGIGVFLFPFVYLIGTSFKTDEELTETAWFPSVPKFEPASPYVRKTPSPVKPNEAPAEKWNDVLPTLRRMAHDAVAAAKLPVGGEAVDESAYRAAAVNHLVSRVAARMNIDAWSGDSAKIIDTFKSLLNADAIAGAFDDRLARLELRGLQARTLDSHIYVITPGEQIATSWKIDSGDARFVPLKEATLLRYRFGSSSDQPIVPSSRSRSGDTSATAFSLSSSQPSARS